MQLLVAGSSKNIFRALARKYLKMSNLTKKKLKIEGMHCSSCALTIDMDLEDLNGVKASKTSYAKSETEIEFDCLVLDEKELIETIKKTGYKAEVVN